VYKGLLFTGSNDCTARCWDVATQKCLREYRGHKQPISCIKACKHSGSRYLFTGSFDQTVILWDIDTASQIRSFVGHSGTIWAINVWGGGKLLFTGSGDGSARAWEVGTGEAIIFFEAHKDEVLCLDVWEGMLYTGSADNTAIAWEVTSGQPLVVMRGHTGSVWALASSIDPTIAGMRSDGKPVGHGCETGLLLTGSHDKSVRVWDADTGEPLKVLAQYRDPVRCMQLWEGVLITGHVAQSGSSSLYVLGAQGIGGVQEWKGWSSGGFDTMTTLCMHVSRGILFLGTTSPIAVAAPCLDLLLVTHTALLHTSESSDKTNTFFVSGGGDTSSEEAVVEVLATGLGLLRMVVEETMNALLEGGARDHVDVYQQQEEQSGDGGYEDDDVSTARDFDLVSVALKGRPTFVSSAPKEEAGGSGGSVTLWRFDCALMRALTSLQGSIRDARELRSGESAEGHSFDAAGVSASTGGPPAPSSNIATAEKTISPPSFKSNIRVPDLPSAAGQGGAGGDHASAGSGAAAATGSSPLQMMELMAAAVMERLAEVAVLVTNVEQAKGGLGEEGASQEGVSLLRQYDYAKDKSALVTGFSAPRLRKMKLYTLPVSTLY
jgi:WD40 repeat protein